MENPPKDLLEKCIGDNRKAHFELYKLCFDDLIKTCRRYYKQDDELKSCVNMVFLKLVQSLNKIEDKPKDFVFFHWMRRIALNHIIDEFRSNKRYKELVDIQEEDDLINQYDSGVDDDFERKYGTELIQLAIDSLPPMSKTVFNLHAIEGYKHHEIAEMLDITASTSKVHFFKARVKLQQALKKERSIYS